MKRLAIKSQQITLDRPDELKRHITQAYRKSTNREIYSGNVPDSVGASFQNNLSSRNNENSMINSFNASPNNNKPPKAPMTKSMEQYLKDLLNGMAICNTVMPIIPKDPKEERILESSSPDEIAYVEFLENNRFK